MARFSDVLSIINGKNQSKVENPHGKYPIYGSGGIMGYADDYICEAQTVIIGRKGNINKPIFVETPFWNVDTAFGLCAHRDILHPKYLYYFCEHFDFEKLNTTVTIPSLTKANLLDIEIDVPSMECQEGIVSRLDKIETIIMLRKQQLSKLDELVKSRFIEMFGDPIKNDKGLPTISGDRLFKLSNGKTLPDEKRLNSGIPAYGGNGISWYTDEVLCDYDTIIVGRVGFQSGNVHYAKAPLWVTDNAMYLSELFIKDCELGYLCALMEHIDFTRYQDAGDLKKITQKPFMQMLYLLPPHEQQKEFLRFVEQTDKSKSEIQKSLEKLETLKKALMQKYFG